MVKKILVVSALSLSALLSGCASLQGDKEMKQTSVCLDCEPQQLQVETQFIPVCPKSVEVIQYIPSCTQCTYPVTVRSSAQTCTGN